MSSPNADIIASNGNTFEDLGRAGSQDRLAKAELSHM
jgi:hypothetical protein